MIVAPQERIFRRSEPEPNSGCWLWMGKIMHGYGTMLVGKTRVFAHYWACYWFNGTFPDEFVVHHTCNQTRCVNPHHLKAIPKEIHDGLCGLTEWA